MRDIRVKKLIRAIVMTVIAVFLFVSINLLFSPKYIEENREGRITPEFYREQTNDDVIFVGSSTVNSAINPVLLWDDYGITSYDRSGASQTSWISYYMIKDAIEVSDPKMVVVDMSFFRYGDDYCEEPENRKALDGMRLSHTKFQCLRTCMNEDEKYVDYVFPIGRYHTRWNDLKAEDWKYLYHKPTITFSGFIPEYEIEPAEGIPMDRSELDVRMSQRNLLFLENIIGICQSNGIQVLLIKIPSFEPKWGDSFERDVLSVADVHAVEYIDFDRFTDEIGIDYMTDTNDAGGHLNDAGAEKFTRYLGKVMTKSYELTDHRGDPAFDKAWKEKSERYHYGR